MDGNNDCDAASCCGGCDVGGGRGCAAVVVMSALLEVVDVVVVPIIEGLAGVVAGRRHDDRSDIDGVLAVQGPVGETRIRPTSQSSRPMEKMKRGMGRDGDNDDDSNGGKALLACWSAAVLAKPMTTTAFMTPTSKVMTTKTATRW